MHRRLLLLLSVIAISWNFTFAQTAKIVNEHVSPEGLIKMGLTTTTNSVATGLNVVGNGTYVYLSAKNLGSSDPVTGAEWSFNSKPSGSNASFQAIPGYNTWTTFLADVKGAYEVKLHMTTAAGSHDTTLTIYSADFIGAGNFEGVPAQFPQCMSCHSGMPKFAAIFDKWKDSPHATKFRRDITGTNTHYSNSCLRCHTVGYSHNLASSNGGFDDRAEQLGWKWDGGYAPPKPGNWDTLKTKYPSLVSFATIGCESCHGPGSEHAMGGDTKKIQVSATAGACAQCHDEPWRHNKVAQYENSKHSEAIYESGFGTANGKQDLTDCTRCHEGQGFINFTKGEPYNPKTAGLNEGTHVAITCATCHDPHTATLRTVPASSDTLGNGYNYSSVGGSAQTCMSCHKARRDNVAYTKTKVSSSHWGPHGSVQTDVFLGKNAAEFGTAYNTFNAHTAILQNACVDCHMQTTTDTGTVSRDRVGGHSWNMRDEANDYDHTKKCASCHGAKTKFTDFVAKADYDGDGQVEAVQNEVKGLLTKLRIALPPAGLDSIDYQQIGTLNDLNMKKAYWNYLLIEEDKSFGMHNASFAVAVLQQSLSVLTGVKPTDDITPKNYAISQNFPNPFNPSTTIQFSVPEMANVTLKVYDAIGNEVATLQQGMLSAGNYSVNWNAANQSSGIYFYKISSDKFNMTKKMVLIK